jgi:hypothetical protein
MCQQLSKRIHHTNTKCYRVYSYDNGELVSYYHCCPMPKIGVPTKADYESFHGYRTKKDVTKFFSLDRRRDTSVIFECVLSTRLKSGVWSVDKEIKTCTGDILTLVRQVGRFNANTNKLTWTA